MTKVHIRDVIPDSEVTLLDRLGDSVSKFLEHADELPARELAVIDGLGSRYDHLAGLEDKGSHFGVTDMDADLRKSVLGWIQRCVDGAQRS